MSFRKILPVVSVLVMCAFVLISCAPAAATTAPAAAAPVKTVKVVKVAILLTGPIQDGGGNAYYYKALEALKAEGGFETAYTESLAQADIAAAIQGYASQGYDIVFGGGSQFSSPVMDLAAQFPKTYFFVNSTAPANTKIPANVQFIEMHLEKDGYVLGALAALISKSGKVGFVGGADTPSIRKIANGFLQGATDTVPSITANTIITGDFNDASKGREAALALIGNGADVIAQQADTTGLGAISAAVEKKLTVIGTRADQSSMAPAYFAASLILNWYDIYILKAHEVRDGTFKGGIEWESGFDVSYALVFQAGRYNTKLVSKDAVAKMDAILKGLNDGSIKVVQNYDPPKQ